MNDFLRTWFTWFEDGMTALPQEAQEQFFRTCGTRCARTAPLARYQALFAQAGQDMDVFFARLNMLEGVGGRVLIPGRRYEIIFRECLCDLHTSGCVHSGCICECSRQSILYVMQTLPAGREVQVTVTLCETILRGGSVCRFVVEVEGTAV